MLCQNTQFTSHHDFISGMMRQFRLPPLLLLLFKVFFWLFSYVRSVFFVHSSMSWVFSHLFGSSYNVCNCPVFFSSFTKAMMMFIMNTIFFEALKWDYAYLMNSNMTSAICNWMIILFLFLCMIFVLCLFLFSLLTSVNVLSVV